MSRFFGLAPGDKEVFLDQSFLLMYYMGFSYWECYNIPISYRMWFIRRINEEIKRANDKGEGQSRAMHQNTSDVRALQGKQRADPPARLRRFT